MEKEIKKLQLDDNSKQMIQMGVDTVVEPIIELALLVLKKLA